MKTDMTQGSEWRHILFFSLPVMIGLLLQQLYSTVDGIVVGNYVGETALSAVGTSFAPTMVFIALAVGLSSGSGILISQLYGAKQVEELRKAVSTSLIMLFVLGVALSAVGYFCAGAVLSLLSVPDGELLRQATSYFSIYCIGLVFQFVYNSISGILRAVGDSKPTLYFLLISSMMNIALDLLFVIVFKMGVAGAALATIISQFVSMVVSLFYMFRKYEMFRFKRGEFVFDGEKCLVCLRLGIPTTIQQCIVSFNNVALQRIINSFGQSLIAACTVAMRVENYVLVPVFGIQIGMSTFAGQNMGAGRLDRIKSGRRVASIMSVAICIAISALTYIFASPLSLLFGVAEEALGYSVEYIRFMAIFFFAFAYYQVYAATLQGSGDVMYATICTLVSLMIRVACVYAAVYVFNMGYKTIWQTIPIGWAICLSMAAIRFWRGGWKSKGVVKREVQE